MEKYLQVFKISFAQEFAYRLNFVMWRVRNVLQIFLIFFLWDTVFSDPQRVVFGYDRAKILTYVFGMMVVKAIVASSRSIDISSEISQGNLTNYLLKPINYFKYWFARDIASKSLNLAFSVVEMCFLYLLLRPVIFFQTNPLYLGGFLISLILAVMLFYLLMTIFSMVPIWYPENAWGAIFLLIVFVDFLGGGVFPLDVLSPAIQKYIYLSPFPYLIFMPIQIYLGKISLLLATKSIVIAFIWFGILMFILHKVWSLGLKVYRSEGR